MSPSVPGLLATSVSGMRLLQCSVSTLLVPRNGPRCINIRFPTGGRCRDANELKCDLARVTLASIRRAKIRCVVEKHGVSEPQSSAAPYLINFNGDHQQQTDHKTDGPFSSGGCKVYNGCDYTDMVCMWKDTNESTCYPSMSSQAQMNPSRHANKGNPKFNTHKTPNRHVKRDLSPPYMPTVAFLRRA